MPIHVLTIDLTKTSHNVFLCDLNTSIRLENRKNVAIEL